MSRLYGVISCLFLVLVALIVAMLSVMDVHEALVALLPNLVATVAGMIATLLLIDIFVIRRERKAEAKYVRPFPSIELNRAMTIAAEIEQAFKGDPVAATEWFARKQRWLGRHADDLRNYCLAFIDRMPLRTAHAGLEIARALRDLSDVPIGEKTAEGVSARLVFMETLFDVACEDPGYYRTMKAQRTLFRRLETARDPDLAEKMYRLEYPDCDHPRWKKRPGKLTPKERFWEAFHSARNWQRAVRKWRAERPKEPDQGGK